MSRSPEILINSSHSNPTWYCYWFPTDPERPKTLFEDNGPLQKYDEAFGEESRAYELKHNVKPSIWQGHCDKASMVVCLFKEPKRSVTYNGVTFTPHDIQGLLVKVIHVFPTKRDHIGWRYPREHAGEPTPKQIYEGLPRWSNLHIPVIVDVDAYLPVWSYPYSKISFDFDKQIMEMTSDGFPDEAKRYQFDWESNKWIGELNKADKSKNPDFLWIIQAEVDLYKRENWPVENAALMTAFHNPHIYPRDVYDVYIRSI